MAWRRLLALQEVEAELDGSRQRVLVAEWDDVTEDVRVLWPPGPAAFASQSRRLVAAADYEPSDPYGFPGDLF
jgi:hypothetical protein